MTLMLLDNYAAKLTPAEKALQTRYTETALKLAPGLGEAYAARGAVRENDGDLAAPWRTTSARSNCRRVSPPPGSGTANCRPCELAIPRCRDACLARAVELDPLSPVVRGEYAITLAQAGIPTARWPSSTRCCATIPASRCTHLSRSRSSRPAATWSAPCASTRASTPPIRKRARARAPDARRLLRFGALREAESA
jgi:hypothetical protein